MNGREATYSVAHLWRRNGIIWFALLVLLFASLGSAYLRLGAWNTFIGIAISFTKAGLVTLLFMELVRSRALIRLVGVAGLTFLFIFFGLTVAEVWMRLTGR